jgi:eukaryotic-like serine/threonine-protein kinase
MTISRASSWRAIDGHLREFEKARAAGACDLRAFLPEDSDADFLPTLRELVLVDAEYRRAGGQSVSLHEYMSAYPQLASDELLRSYWTESLGPSDDGPDWPAVGDLVDGFELIEPLGEGAFARVYLARQSALADRQVVVKLSRRALGEVHKLGRLQHANVVPLFSAHDWCGFQILCMPFLGRDTLQSRRSRSFREALGWSAGMASGLGHAHERGILHLDLKPANVLVTDDQTPMLLDFNLAAAQTTTAELTGGTIAYMSPEQIEHVCGGQPTITTASDVYSMGLLLWELLLGRPAFKLPPKLSPQAMESLLQQRQRGDIDWTMARGLNRSLIAILRRCLVPQPEARYPSGVELAEDLQREWADLPLRHAGRASLLERAGKWTRRHPRAASMLVMGTIAAAALTGLGAAYVSRGQQLVVAQRQDSLRQLDSLTLQAKLLLGATSPSPKQLETGMRVAGQATELVQRLGGSTADLSMRLRGAELHLLMARGWRIKSGWPGQSQRPLLEQALAANRRAATFSDSPAIAAQQQMLQADLDGTSKVVDLKSTDRSAPSPHNATAEDARSQYLQGVMLLSEARWTEAAAALSASLKQSPQDPAVWSALGQARLSGLDYEGAIAAFQAAVVLSPDQAVSHYLLGVAYLSKDQFDPAADALGRCIEIDPTFAPAYADRGLAHLLASRFEQAVKDFSDSIARAPEHTRAYLLRSRALEQLGRRDRADEDRKTGLTLDPGDEQSAVTRGVFRLDEPAAAIADFELALRFHPTSIDALQNLAYVHSELLNEPLAATVFLDRLIEHHPTHIDALTSRAVLLARAGALDRAIGDARLALDKALLPSHRYQLAGVFAHASQSDPVHLDKAIELLKASLTQGYGFDLIQSDPDLAAVRDTPKMRELLRAVREMQP